MTSVPKTLKVSKPDWLEQRKVPEQFWHLLLLNLESKFIFLEIESSERRS